MKKQNKIIYAFIDSQNLNLSIRSDVRGKRGQVVYRGWKLDFKRFYIYLKDYYKITKAYLFIGLIPGNEALYKYLKEAGYVLIFKPTLEVSREGKKVIKGNVDAELVLHSMIEYPNYDQAIIVSGDGDFHCLVEHFIKKNKLFKLLIPNLFSYSSLLRKFKTYISFVNILRGKLEERQQKSGYLRGTKAIAGTRHRDS
ncbi:MAG: NYN domain-containing protein [Candidatus Shapirobacteria bacterium]